MDKKNILVTGGLGHIGSQLIRRYSERKDVGLIRIMDNICTQRYCSLFKLPEEGNFEFLEGDVNNDKDAFKAVKGIDTVLHFAAITDAPSTIGKEKETWEANYQGVKNMLFASIIGDPKQFMFPSTTSVYGDAEGVVDETTKELKPQSPYAESKLAAEKMLMEVGREGIIDTKILRLGTIFGKSIGMRFHTAVNKFCWLAAMRKPLTVWDSALGNKRPYLGLGDASRAFEFLENNGESGEIYNVLTKNYTIQEMVDEIEKFVPDLEIEITKSPILNQRSYCVSDKKIRELGFEPKDSLNDEIKSTLELFTSIRN